MILSLEESTTLTQCEIVIERGMGTFVEVGSALLTISDQRLYRVTHGSFDEYVREKWSMTAKHAYRLCEAAEVAKELKCDQFGHTLATEGQARELAKAPKGTRADVLATVKSKGKVTARAIQEAVEVVKPAVEDKPFADANYKPTNGVTFARMAIEQIKRIHANDTQRQEAAALVVDCIKENFAVEDVALPRCKTRSKAEHWWRKANPAKRGEFFWELLKSYQRTTVPDKAALRKQFEHWLDQCVEEKGAA